MGLFARSNNLVQGQSNNLIADSFCSADELGPG